jgi:hypothetical protein
MSQWFFVKKLKKNRFKTPPDLPEQRIGMDLRPLEVYCRRMK